MQDLVIVGVGGMAREVSSLVADTNADGRIWNRLGFLDDGDVPSGSVHDMPVLGGRDWLTGRRVAVAIGIGASVSRARFVQSLSETEPQLEYPRLVHPGSVIGKRVTLGEGCFVGAGTVMTSDLIVGRHVIVNTACSLAHDDNVGDFATLAPGVHLAGACSLGEGVDLGIGTSVVQGVTIGAWSVVGAGAAVISDLPTNCTAVGVPAKVIKQRPEGWNRA